MRRYFCSSKVFRRVALMALTIIGSAQVIIGSTQLCYADSLGHVGSLGHAESLGLPRDDAFYHQLLKLPDSNGYLPTRSFAIIVDTEHGNQLVAEDDPNLRFNLLWMQQFQPGYRSNHGGSAFGEIFRSYLKTAYKAYRDHNAQSMAALPDENGSIHAKNGAANLIEAMDYNFKVTGDEVRFKVQYNY